MTKNDFFSQEHLKVDKLDYSICPFDVYSLKDSKQIIYEIKIDSVAKNKPCTEIGMVTDIHFNYANAQDFQDEEIMETIKYRKWLANATAVPSALNALKAASFLDQIVVCGDTLDYLSNGTMELTKKLIFDAYPNSLCVLGGHEITKSMQSPMPNKLSLDERLKIVEDFWLHDAHYHSVLLNENVLCIGLDNSTNHYYNGTSIKLEKDLSLAREKGYTVLVFQHEPLNTGDAKYNIVDKPILPGDIADFPLNFYNGCENIGFRDKDTEEDKKVVDLITHNAEVVRGIFSGHTHNVFYFESLAFTSSGEPSVIPQYNMTANAYICGDTLGHVTRIIVK